MINLGDFPLALMVLALLIPLVYTMVWKPKYLKDVVVLVLVTVLIALFYPITPVLSEALGNGNGLGYFAAKLLLFVALPAVAIFLIEGWGLRKIFYEIGVRKKRFRKSLLYSLGVLVVTVAIGLLVGVTGAVDVVWNSVMFFEAFTEEFFFRGVLFLYLLKKTNTKVAYATSVLAFVLAHPQHLDRLFVVSTIIQGSLLAIVTHKTKNILGPWVSHGLNRTLPSLIRMFF